MSKRTNWKKITDDRRMREQGREDYRDARRGYPALEKWADKLLGGHDAKTRKPPPSKKTQKPNAAEPASIGGAALPDVSEPNFVTIYENGIAVTIGRYWMDESER